MPRPVYILCSESGSDDKTTGLVSHFNVIEQIELREFPRPSEAPVSIVQPISMQITAVWARTEEDNPEDEYEIILSLFTPGQEAELVAATGTAIFEMVRFRSTVYVRGLILRREGRLRAVAKLRPTGGDEDSWLVQTYEIPVVRIPGEAGDQAPLPPPQ